MSDIDALQWLAIWVLWIWNALRPRCAWTQHCDRVRRRALVLREWASLRQDAGDEAAARRLRREASRLMEDVL